MTALLHVNINNLPFMKIYVLKQNFRKECAHMFVNFFNVALNETAGFNAHFFIQYVCVLF